ncbi:hypothetical protein [Streptomyces sp. MUM 16J]|nr:hypothetical protein [Streptomyces sp. MUM 16J]
MRQARLNRHEQYLLPLSACMATAFTDARQPHRTSSKNTFGEP